MKFKKLNGAVVSKNISKYAADWDAACLSKFQRGVKDFFRPYWQYHLCYEEIPLVGTRYRLDLYNASLRLAVESHGDQHTKYSEFFHGNVIGYLNQIKRDSKKLNWCEINGIRLIEIYYDELKLLTPEWIKEKFDIEL